MTQTMTALIRVVTPPTITRAISNSVGNKEFVVVLKVVVVFKVVLGDVVADIVFVVGVNLHSLLKSVRVPGTVQLNFATC